MCEVLVRDRFPEFIQRRGGVPSYRLPAGEQEFLQFLFGKLGEEYYEYINGADLGKLADMFEVVRSLTAYFNTTIPELMTLSSNDHAEFAASLSPNKVWQYFCDRLLNEMYAFIKSRRLEDLGNMLSTMNALCNRYNSNIEHLAVMADGKKELNGAFEKRYILTL